MITLRDPSNSYYAWIVWHAPPFMHEFDCGRNGYVGIEWKTTQFGLFL